MKTLASLGLAALSTALAHASEPEATDLAFKPSLRVAPLAKPVSLQSTSTRRGQVWVGIGSLSYEHFAGDSAGDEFGFTPTGYLGYQRNFYPGGRTTNGVGYSAGIGLAALGAAIFYHQGSPERTDFRIGIAADFVYYRNFSFFGDEAYFNLVPFAAWGIKI